MGSAVLVWAWIRDPGSDQASDSIALTHTPRGMLRREHHLGNAPEHCLYKSGCYPLFCLFFPAPAASRDSSTPSHLCAPRGGAAAPAVKQRQLQGTGGLLPKPVADSSEAFPVPAVEAGADAGLRRRAISLFTPWHGSTQRARTGASAALSWGSWGFLTYSSGRKDPPCSPQHSRKTASGSPFPPLAPFPRCAGAL